MSGPESSGKGSYFKEMDSTWQAVGKFMLSKLSQFKEESPEAFASVMSNPVVKKRLSAESPKARPFLMRLSFELCKGGDWKRIIPACAAVEFLNISTYVINAVFDEKGEEQSKKDINKYFIVGMICRELASECLSEVKVSLSPEDWKTVHCRLSEINKQVYAGGIIDLYVLKKENIGSFFSIEEMKQLYLTRVEKFCGIFMKNIAFIGAIFSNATQNQTKALQEFGLNYGSGIQIINDLGDFAYKTNAIDFEKSYQDLYSDIKHGKLIFPVILGLENTEPNLIKELLGKKNSTSAELQELSKYLADSGIVEKTRQLSKTNYYACKKALKEFPESQSKTFLSIMASILRSNKYFVFFRELSKQEKII